MILCKKNLIQNCSSLKLSKNSFRNIFINTCILSLTTPRTLRHTMSYSRKNPKPLIIYTSPCLPFPLNTNCSAAPKMRQKKETNKSLLKKKIFTLHFNSKNLPLLIIKRVMEIFPMNWKSLLISPRLSTPHPKTLSPTFRPNNILRMMPITILIWSDIAISTSYLMRITNLTNFPYYFKRGSFQFYIFILTLRYNYFPYN